MDGNFALRPEIYKAIRQDRLAQADRERRVNEANPPWTPRILFASLRLRIEDAASIIRTPREPDESSTTDRLIEPKPQLA